MTPIQIAAYIKAGKLPNPVMTPGKVDPAITQDNINNTICITGYTAGVRPPQSYTEDLKRRQLKRSGFTDIALKDYEEDHLIPLTLGGHPTDPSNLWPQTRKGVWTAARKDQLEVTLGKLVCKGTVTLADAQTVMAVNWIIGWKIYVKGEQHALPSR